MKLPLEIPTFLYLVLSFLVFVEAKGGGGGRGGGSRSGGKGISKSRAAVVLGSGAAGYAAYKAHKSLRKGDRERERDGEGPDLDSYDQYVTDAEGKYDYKLQESTSYYATEGIGMSAWGLLALILGFIGLGTLAWYCCNVFMPVWEDNRQMRRRSMLGRMKDEVPLQETPSTATPSP